MDIPLTPLEFMRRTRRLHGHREALVDGDLRLTYAQFFDRCDRFSAVLQRRFGVKPGERVAYVAPNTHAQLESFYAVPQVGAVLVPINYRLTADDFAYIIAHSGAKVVCAHSDYQAMIDGVRERIPDAGHFVALEGKREGWLDYEELIATAVAPGEPAVFERPAIAETDLLTINYRSRSLQPPGSTGLPSSTSPGS
jgi:fatty-acyl-CoA synthase